MLSFDIERRNIGLNFFGDEKAEFVLWAPVAKNIEIIFNDKMVLVPEKNEFGYWKIITGEIRPGDTYQLKIDNRKILPDPASLSQPEGVHGSSRAFDLRAFTWEDDEWEGIRRENLVIYELHTGTFTEEGTFDGICRKIDYLKDLGINAIEIMPVAQFPGSRNWGYDGVYPFAVQNSYGGASGFQKLVNTCHKNGLAVILDVVYNHLGPEGNYLNEFGPYFTDKYKTPWGKAINFDDAWCDGVRRYYKENMLMWFRDFHVDALRLDAVHAIKDFSAKHILQEFRENVNRLKQLTGKNYLLIGEVDLNDTRYISPLEKGGYELDMQWCDEFHHALHAILTHEQKGYYSDFGEISQLVKSFNDVYVYDGIYSPHRKKVFGSKTTGIEGDQFVVFTQNHDQVGNRMKGDRLTEKLSHEALKLAAGAMFISPFIPLLFMGEEYGETNPFLYFTSHSDENLIELVRKGRIEEFKDFMDAQNVPDPQSVETFKRSKLQTETVNRKDHALFAYYKKLIELKKNHPAWKEHNRVNLIAREIIENVILLTKKNRVFLLLALMNFDTREIKFNFADYSENKLFVLMDSSEEKWGGNRVSPLLKKNEIKLMPSSFVVLSDISE